MKKQLTQLLQKTYFYTHEGRTGIKSLSGSGTITVPRWTPVHEVYKQALDAIVLRIAEESPGEDFKPWFTRFERIK